MGIDGFDSEVIDGKIVHVKEYADRNPALEARAAGVGDCCFGRSSTSALHKAAVYETEGHRLESCRARSQGARIVPSTAQVPAAPSMNSVMLIVIARPWVLMIATAITRA